MIASPEKEELLASLADAEAKVRRIERLVAADRACLEVLARIAAVSQQLDDTAVALLDAHSRSCVQRALADDGSAAADLLDALYRFSKVR